MSEGRSAQLMWQASRDDRRVLWTASAVFATAYAVGSVLQAAYVYAAVVDDWSHVEMWQRAAANAVAVLALLAGLGLWGQHRRTSARALVSGVALSAVALAVVRVVGQVVFGVYPGFHTRTTVAELVAGVLIGVVSAGVGTAEMLGRRVIRQQSRANEQLAVERALALRALEVEEIRVRRDVAEGLHASAQQHLVMLVARLDRVTARLRDRAESTADVEELQAIRRDLDAVRERDIRGMSRLLYPDHIELGLVPAARALLRRVPASVATQLNVDPKVRAADTPVSLLFGPTERLLAVRVIEEGITNALRHARPSTLSVDVYLNDGVLCVSVQDDGAGFDDATISRSGTERLAERLSIVGGRLRLASTPGTGTLLSARIPLEAPTRV
ncbi:MAG TPA: ATP-binding protein [Cellulomonas sp.]